MQAETKHFRDDGKSYLLVVGLGLSAGIITRLSDLFPAGTLWSFNSIATLFGFWMLTATLMIYFSGSNKNAAINVFLYLFSMNFSFYLLPYLLGFCWTRYSGQEFNWHLFFVYDLFALVGGAVAYVLYFWKQGNTYSSLLYALPISGLAAETLGLAWYFYHSHTFLFQLIFDFLSLAILGWWFYKKSANKPLYLATVTTVAAIGYWLVYRPFI